MLAIALLQCGIANAKTYYVKDCGLSDAKNGKERFELLRRAHENAVSIGAAISYEGIETIEVEIPLGAKSIQLSSHTDFAGVELKVKNTTTENFSLFVLSQKLTKVKVTKEQITSGRFGNVNELRRGEKILVIEDETPWVANRLGYNYGATRKDILYLKGGKARGTVTAAYNNEQSSPKCYYCDVKGRKTWLGNLVFTRTSDSEQITKLFGIKNQNNVLIENVTINTPESYLYGDCAIGIQNVTNLKMVNIIINGTYSQEKKYGYGISMDNVWNVRFTRLNANGKWGIFGNNNVNYAIIEDSDINRFDIHCYGKDVFCYRTTFRNIYNQFSSLYGRLVFDGCEFVDFIPVLFEYSYSAYTPFELTLKDCKIRVKKGHPYLVAAGNAVLPPEGTREELRSVSWPNVTLENVAVTLPQGEKTWMLFKLNSKPTVSIKHIRQVKINGLNINGVEIDQSMAFSNFTIKTEDVVSAKVKGSSIMKMDI